MDMSTTVTATCQSCGATWERPRTRGRPPKYCQDCKTGGADARARYAALTPEQRAERNARRNALRAAERAGRPDAVTATCQTCGATWERPRTPGPLPVKCRDCKRADTRRRDTARYAALTPEQRAERNAAERARRAAQPPAPPRPRQPLPAVTYRFVCEHCGRPAERTTTRVGGRGGSTACPFRYCSRTCNQAASSLRRRHRARAGGASEPYTRAEVMRRDDWTCGICGGFIDPDDYGTFRDGRRAPGPASPSIDHVLPLAAGGTDTLDNVQAAHYLCNGRKSYRVDYQPAAPIGPATPPDRARADLWAGRADAEDARAAALSRAAA